MLFFEHFPSSTKDQTYDFNLYLALSTMLPSETVAINNICYAVFIRLVILAFPEF